MSISSITTDHRRQRISGSLPAVTHERPELPETISVKKLTDQLKSLDLDAKETHPSQPDRALAELCETLATTYGDKPTSETERPWFCCHLPNDLRWVSKPLPSEGEPAWAIKIFRGRSELIAERFITACPPPPAKVDTNPLIVRELAAFMEHLFVEDKFRPSDPQRILAMCREPVNSTELITEVGRVASEWDATFWLRASLKQCEQLAEKHGSEPSDLADTKFLVISDAGEHPPFSYGSRPHSVIVFLSKVPNEDEGVTNYVLTIGSCDQMGETFKIAAMLNTDANRQKLGKLHSDLFPATKSDKKDKKHELNWYGQQGPSPKIQDPKRVGAKGAF